MADEVVTKTIPYSDLTISEAAEAAADGHKWWVQTMPAILYHFGLSLSEYWDSLTVAEHAHMIEFLQRSDLIGGGNGARS